MFFNLGGEKGRKKKLLLLKILIVEKTFKKNPKAAFLLKSLGLKGKKISRYFNENLGARNLGKATN